MLDHFFHHEWIAHQETNDLGSLESSFAAQNGAQLEFREEHKSFTTNGSRHKRSKSGNDFAALVALKNSTMSGCPTADLSAATTDSNVWNK
jgi:hypothetical protein